jgi:Protein of unknown function (DUF2939)
MNAVKALLLAAIVAGLGVAVWWYYGGTPQHSLALMADAVRARDYETARYFVDDERIAETASKSVLDAAMTQFTNKMKADDNPFSGLGVAAFQMMAPRIKDTAKDNIKESIKQALSGDDTLTNRSGALRFDSSRFSHLRIAECVVSGKTAEVVIDGIPQPNPAQITEVHLRMARIPNSRDWRIEEIPELAQAYVKLLDSEKTSPQPSEAANVTKPTVPAVTVSKPNRVLELSTNGVCGIDYLNAPVWDGEKTWLPLKDGKHETKEDFGGSSTITVKHVFCVGRGVGEHALLVTDWLSCGASCNDTGMVQVYEPQAGHPVLIQQIGFDSDAVGTDATFDKDSSTLTITGRSNDGSAHCCPQNLDVVTYQWEGQEFVQTSYKRVPVPPS